MNSGTSTNSLQPWQFFVLAALASATAAIFLIQARGVTSVVLLTILMAAAALVGLAALRAVRPLVSPHEDRVVLGERTRDALEREKSLTLRTIKELEFDRAMGKISAEDFLDMSGRLRARAARLIRQIDARAGYREQVERDLADRLGTAKSATPGHHSDPASRSRHMPPARGSAPAYRVRQQTTRTPGSARRAGRSCDVAGSRLSSSAGTAARSGLRSDQRSRNPRTAGVRPETDVRYSAPCDRPSRSSCVGPAHTGRSRNNVSNHSVELHVDGRVETATTDESGRAQFDNLTPGATVRAVAVVDGETLTSEEFPAPARGGIRLILVATDTRRAAKGREAASAAPVGGQVAIAGDSRIVIENDEETVRVFYVFDIVNAAGTPVNLSQPFAFEAPRGAMATTVLDGSSPKASAKGTHVVVEGPFPPGTTPSRWASPCRRRAAQSKSLSASPQPSSG